MLPGVVLDSHFTFSPHVTRVVAQAAQSAYGLKVLKSCGLPTESLNLVYRATIVACVIYASPCWWGDLSAADRGKLQAVLDRASARALVHVIPFHCLICVSRQTLLSSGQLQPINPYTMFFGLFFLPYGLTLLLSPSGTNSPS